MNMNYAAIYVTFATFFMLVVHALAPSAILAMIFAVLVPVIITIMLVKSFEVHEYRDE